MSTRLLTPPKFQAARIAEDQQARLTAAWLAGFAACQETIPEEEP